MENYKANPSRYATGAELKAAISCNSKTFRLMSSKVEELKRVTAAAKAKAKSKSDFTATIEFTEPPRTVTVEINKEFEEEVDYYFSELNQLTLEELESDIEDVLPARSHNEYERILRRLQAELLRNINEVREFINAEDLSISDRAELETDIALDQKKILAIHAVLHKTQDVLTATEPVNNDLILVPTSGGNIRILDEIEHIDLSYYHKFEGLISSIKNGTFKGVKKLHGELAGLTEVKDRPSGARVTFMRLDKNTYAIISAFIKRSDNSAGYQKMVANSYQSYREIEPVLKANLSNPEFIKLNQDYEQELFRKLNPTSDSKKAPVYELGGAK